MIGRASIAWRRGARTMAPLLCAAVLAACSNSEQAMNEKLAAAQAAAEKAVAAQKAAERAAANAAGSRPPAPPAPVPVISDTGNDLAPESNSDEMAEHDVPLPGGAGQTVTADGVVIPG